MSNEEGSLHWMLEDMLASENPEWSEAIKVTVNVLYRQFELETRREKTVVTLSKHRLRQGPLYKKYGD